MRREWPWKSCEIPCDKNTFPRRHRGGMCSPHGNGRGLELYESVTGCRPAGRGINLNGITPLLPVSLFLLHLLFHIPQFQSHGLSLLSACLIPLFYKVLQERARILHGSKELCTANILLFRHLSAAAVHQLYFEKTSMVRHTW